MALEDFSYNVQDVAPQVRALAFSFQTAAQKPDRYGKDENSVVDDAASLYEALTGEKPDNIALATAADQSHMRLAFFQSAIAVSNSGGWYNIGEETARSAKRLQQLCVSKGLIAPKA